MKRKIAANALYMGGILALVGAVGCGGGIENAASGWAVLGWCGMGLALMAGAVALWVLGERVEHPQRRKVHQAPRAAVRPPHKRRAG